MSQRNLYVTGKNGKRLGGGAAQLRRIKEYGGWDAYHEELIGRVTKKVYEEVMDEMNSKRMIPSTIPFVGRPAAALISIS